MVKLCEKLSLIISGIPAIFASVKPDNTVLASNLFSTANYASISPNVYFEKMDGAGGSSQYCTRYDVTNENTQSVKGEKVDFSRKNDYVLGQITEIKESAIDVIESRTTYQSGWCPWQSPTTKDLLTRQYNTYKFQHYIDVPTHNFTIPESVAPGKKVSFDIEIDYTYSETYESSSKIGINAYWEYALSWGYKLGVKGNWLDLISGGSESSTTSGWKVGGQLYTEMSSTSTKSSSMAIKYKRTFEYNNTSGSEYKKFKPCIRQKYAVYFTTCYDFDYECNYYTSGTFGIDKHWDYRFLETYSGIQTTFFLMPVNDPYFEISEYTTSDKGLDENVRGLADNIYFL